MINRFLHHLNISEPTVILDEQRVKRNIERMVNRARSAGVQLRHHAKTHQSAEIASWFKKKGFSTITVSSLSMAGYFADHGWTDITVAFPVNILEIKRINRLAGKIRLDLLVDSTEAVAFLDTHAEYPLGIWIKVDAGYRRAGIPWDDAGKIVCIAQAIEKSSLLNFQGLLTHAGNTYKAVSIQEIRRIHFDYRQRLNNLKKEILKTGISGCRISIGDTPSCSVGEDFNEVDDIRPGNFVFYDQMQYQLGVCGDYDTGAALACPVVGKYPHRRQIVIYGGGVHLSKESMLDEQGHRIYGYLAFEKDGTWGQADKGAPVIGLSQEHGIVEIDGGIFDEISIGDVVVVLPVHICLTVSPYSSYTTLGGRKILKMTGNCR